MLNKERVKELAAYINSLDETSYNQTQYSFSQGAMCGSPACLGGHAVFLAFMKNPKEVSELFKNSDYSDDDSKLENVLNQPAIIDDFLTEWLGLTVEQCYKMTAAWPHISGGPKQVKPRHAAKLLYNLIETNKVDWSSVL